MKKLIAVPVIALAAGISLAACGQTVTKTPVAVPTNSAPAGTVLTDGPGSGAMPAPASPAPADPAATQAPAPTDTPAAAPTMVSQSDIVVFSVTGSGAPSIQYGNGATTNNPNDGAGPLGDGNYLPWHASMTYSPGALYYAVTAQNEGSGSISDTVTEQVTTVCSNGTHTESFPLANGSANGGYGIASAQYNNLGSGTGNASQAESDAGC